MEIRTANRIGRRKRRVADTTLSAPRELTVDDLIGTLVELFESLGVDATRLADRIDNINAPKFTRRQPHPHTSEIGELLTLWHQDPHYLDSSGNPIALRMLTGPRSFRSLAKKAVPKLKAKHVLSELTKVGAISLDKSGLIHVHMRSLPVYEDRRLAIQHTITALGGFIKTLRHNLESERSNSDQLFHRIAWNGDIRQKEIPKLKIWVKKHGQNFLESADTWMMRRSNSPASETKRGSKSVQVSVGIYLAVEKS